jgi:hypothetical protein
MEKKQFSRELDFLGQGSRFNWAMLGRFEPTLYRALFYTTPSVSGMKEIARRTVHEYRYACKYP